VWGRGRLFLPLYRKSGQWSGMFYNVDLEMGRVGTGLGEQNLGRVWCCLYFFLKNFDVEIAVFEWHVAQC